MAKLALRRIRAFERQKVEGSMVRVEGSTKCQVSHGQGGEATRGAPPIGRLYDVEERQLMLLHSGTGAPAVVLLPGAGMTGLGYLNIHDQVSQFTTSVLYDRAGTGWSDHVQLPRTATDVVDELRQLLRVAAVQPPYLLVGHSLGGIYARRFAQRFPDDVAGLVLLDPAHEDYLVRMPKATLLENLQSTVGVVRVLLQFKRCYRGLFQQMFAAWPDSVREALVAY